MPIRPKKIKNSTVVSETSQILEATAPATVPGDAGGYISKEKRKEKSGEIISAGRSVPTVAEESMASLIGFDLVIFALVLLLVAALLSIRKRRRRRAIR